MTKKETNPYKTMWYIFIGILILCNILFFFMLEGGSGRWECVETKQYQVSKCDLNAVNTKGEYPCSVKFEEKCVKEVWTRKW